MLLAVVGLSSGSSFCCSFCPCVFSSQVDLDLHLKAFGSVSHLRLWRSVHFHLEVGVDNRDGYEFSLDNRKARYWLKVRKK
jgi:hypothetical protein